MQRCSPLRRTHTDTQWSRTAGAAIPGAKLTVRTTCYSLEPHPGILVREPKMWKDCAATSMSARRACHRSSRHCPFSVYSSPFLHESSWYTMGHAVYLPSLQYPGGYTQALPGRNMMAVSHHTEPRQALQLPVSRKQAPHLTA